MSAPTRSSVLRDAIGLGLAVGLYGAAFGAAADAAGLDLWQAMTLSALMFTGASQFALVGVLGAGGARSPPPAAPCCWAPETRSTASGWSPLLQPRGSSGGWATAHWVIDETTALSIAAPDRALARLAFLAGGASIFLTWNATTVVGALGAAALTGPALAALDAVVPAAFLALLWPRLRRGFPEAARAAAGRARRCGHRAGADPVRAAGVQVIAAVVAVALAGAADAEVPA